jgi:hypothetical protein
MSDFDEVCDVVKLELTLHGPSHRGIGFHSPNADLIKPKHAKSVLEDHVSTSTA